MQIRPFFLTLLLGFVPAPALADELYGPPETAPPEGLVPPAPTTTIRAIAVRGNQRIPDDRVLLSIALNPGDRATAKDLAATQAKVMAMGYFHACRVGFEPQGRLVIEVQENPVFGDVRLTGVTKLDPEQLRALFAPLRGDVVNVNELKDALAAVRKRYAEAGYPLAQVADVTARPDGIFELRIAEGVVHGVRVTGNVETKAFVVLRELTTRPGEVLSAERLKGDLRRLYNLDLFESVEPSFEPAPVPDQVVLVLAVKEKQTGSVNLSGTYDPTQGMIGSVGLKKGNLWGLDHQAGVELSVSQALAVSGALSYAVPVVDEAHTAVGGSVYLRRFNNFLANYRDDRAGASVTASRPVLGPTLETPFTATLGLKGEQIGAHENLAVGGAIKPLFGAGDDPRLAGKPITLSPGGTDTEVTGTLGLSYDTRDLKANPTTGSFDQVTLEPALVNGDAPLLRASGVGSYFWALPSLPWAGGRPSVLALGSRLGLTGGSRVPAYERLYSTGAYLIRGWPEFAGPDSALGRKYPLNYFQGANAAVGMLEYRFPLWGPLSGLMFMDSGLFWDDALFDSDGRSLLHSGYGLGLRAETPLGMLSLDYGLSGLEPGQLHFGIGQRF